MFSSKEEKIFFSLSKIHYNEDSVMKIFQDDLSQYSTKEESDKSRIIKELSTSSLEDIISSIKEKIDFFSFQCDNIIDYVNLLYEIKNLCSIKTVSNEQKRRLMQCEIEIINKMKNLTEIQLQMEIELN